MLTNDEMCMSRRSFQIWSASQFMPWDAIRGCLCGARKFCVPSKALTNLFGQLAVSYLVLALELFAMSRIYLTARQALAHHVFCCSMKIYLGFTVAGSRSSIEAAKRILTVLQSLGHEVLTSHLVSDDAWRADRRVVPQKMLWMSPSQFVQIRDAISQECHRFLRPIEDFSELGDSLLRPGTHHHDLNVSANSRQIVDQLEGDFSCASKLIHKLLP